MKPRIDLTHRLVYSFDAAVSTSNTGAVQISHSSSPRAIAAIAGGVLIGAFPLMAWLSTRSLVPTKVSDMVFFIALSSVLGVPFMWWGITQLRRRWSLTFVDASTAEFILGDRLPVRLPRASMKFKVRPCWVIINRIPGLWRGWLLTVSWPECELALSMHKDRTRVDTFGRRLSDLLSVPIHESADVRLEKERL